MKWGKNGEREKWNEGKRETGKEGYYLLYP